jgi:hypothetical protein
MKKSTYLKHISYDPKTKQMAVTFTDGAVVLYYGIHSKTVATIDGADSAGAKFSQLVHDHRFKILKSAA